MDTDVLISGAGPTGLFLANLLAMENIPFRIMDENPSRVRESRALAIQARTLELFQKTGLIDEFLKRGMQGVGISFFIRGDEAFRVNFTDIGRDDTPFPYLFFLSQSVTEEILENNLNKLGHQVERNTKLDRFDQDKDGIRAIVGNQKIACRYLVGCDGARSSVRKGLGLSFEGGTYDAEFKLADAKIDFNLPHDRLMLFMGEENLAMVLPLKGSELSRVITVEQRPDETGEVERHLTTKVSATIEEVEKELQSASSLAIPLRNPDWVTGYRVHHRSVDKMREGRVFLAGDAAHIHSPAGGQGMNTGLQDAANLAWKLGGVIKGKFSSDILETYNSERMPVARKLLHFTDRFFTFASSTKPTFIMLRNLVIPFVGKQILSRSFGRKFMFGFVSQLNIKYHESAVVGSDLRSSREKSVHAGMRAPDGKMSDGSTLFDHLRGYSFHVLVMSKKALDEKKRQELQERFASSKIISIDETNGPEILRLYEVEDILISQIRPDGYIGYQADRL